VGTIEEPYDFFNFSTGTSDVEHDGYSLEQSTPNPTKGLVEIGFHIPTTTDVQITVFDVNGKIMMQENKGVMNAGRHVASLDLSALSKGVYYYELRTKEFNGVKKLVKQ
jgi:hypothetical protein